MHINDELIRRYLRWRNAEPGDPEILKVQKKVKVA